MTVPTARTWADNDPLNTTNLNTGVRDPTNYMLADRPIGQLRQSVTQTLTTGTWAPVTFTTEDVDSHNAHSTSSNTSRYTAPEDGWYEVAGCVVFNTSATGNRFTRWAKNGTAITGSSSTMPGVAGTVASLAARTMLVQLAAGDYIELHAWQNTGGNLDTAVVDESASVLTVTWKRKT